MTVARLALFAALTFAGAAAPAYADVVIRVDQSTQRMTVNVDGQQLYDWRVSTGRPGYDTPNGNFLPNRMDADHVSKEYDNAPMPHAIFFDLHGHAIHGSYDPIGHPAASHGCVRLDPAHAATLFALVKEEGMAHTHVQISGDVLVALRNMKRSGKVAVASRRPRVRRSQDSLGVVYGQAAAYQAQPAEGGGFFYQPTYSDGRSYGYQAYGYQPYSYPAYNQPQPVPGW